jgi:hypothetical protein
MIAGHRSDADKDSHSCRRERRLESLIERLPRRAQAGVRWLRRPSSRRVRIPAAVLLMAGGFLGFLPVLGLWMLPLGLVLLAEDLPPVRRAVDRVLEWLEQRQPHWFKRTDADSAAPSASPESSLSPDAGSKMETASTRHVSTRH